MKKQNKKGFSLLELILVLGVGTTVTFMKFQDMKNEQETVVAKAVGDQIKQMGEAVNSYINIRYDKLSTLTSSSSQSSDPGPRMCSGSVCEITYQTLVNEGLLPSSFSGINAQKSSYKIFLRRSGNVPNYIINGLITTTNVWADGSKVRYDLLGKAMQAAGIDSGMTKTTTAASGYGGQWSELSTDYSNITAAGLLAYRVGYDSAMYSVYLRRDGTLPMTGDLNMGGQNIYNAQNITAAGTTMSGTLKSTGETQVGTTLTVGSNASVGGDITASGNVYSGQSVIANGNMATNGLSPGDHPAGWGGGLRTWDIIAGGTIATLKPGTTGTDAQFATMINKDGYIYASGNIFSGQTITANGSISTGDSVYAKNSIYTGNESSTKAYMNKDGNIYGSGNAQLDGNINANGNINSYSQITASQRLTTGEFLQINGVANVGWGCSPNGLQGRAANGAILSCVNGLWKAADGNSIKVCANYCGGQWPLEVGRVEHNGDWSSWRTLGEGCGGGYASNWNEPVFCSSN
ncbi:shufflon system plasmid conjugative transfer pilus tip adhesin PilV [Dickeya lacustris]|uniref:Shufflon system plasmid conjugative transfer pilus tip adhesin PilV n=1 Tax=Dickeya lacustris TaxID=2259638 RepID=A0ABY8G6L9_9GAMM|nr:shufflon system plasmid conjugative transfer pilus tip adhesin PilV [Dickeya lacustris]WFN55608.1 shufflon system plasmid conjugative transfer pilus tip adhesin PilV [Dickeya lacustris]